MMSRLILSGFVALALSGGTAFAQSQTFVMSGVTSTTTTSYSQCGGTVPWWYLNFPNNCHSKKPPYCGFCNQGSQPTTATQTQSSTDN